MLNLRRPFQRNLVNFFYPLRMCTILQNYFTDSVISNANLDPAFRTLFIYTEIIQSVYLSYTTSSCFILYFRGKFWNITKENKSLRLAPLCL
jgi:hypothetical protein